MKVSIIIPCFKRMEYLNYTLWSLSQQKISYDIETLVLNDYLLNGIAKEICNKYKSKLNIRYIFTGQRNTKDKIIKRDQGFVLNIGVKQAKGDIIVLAHNGLFHLNNTIDLIINPLIENKKILSIPKSIFFDSSGIAEYLSENLTIELPKDLLSIPKSVFWGKKELSPKLPYWMGMYRKEFMDIGGHDEDFIGICGLDDDLVDRLQLNKLKYYRCNTNLVHLYHSKYLLPSKNRWTIPEWVYNTCLRLGRKGQIVRNENKEWGAYE